MNYSRVYDTNHCVDEDPMPQSGYQYDHHDSSSSSMVVSDADADDDDYDYDDASFMGSIKQHTRLTGDDMKVDVESSSFTSTTFVLDDELHEVTTPELPDSKPPIIAKPTTRTVPETKNTDTNTNTTRLPFCPPLSNSTRTDDCKTKTSLTIESRDRCAQDSPRKLVDEYEVKYDRYGRHDFNACLTGTSKPEDNASQQKEKIMVCRTPKKENRRIIIIDEYFLNLDLPVPAHNIADHPNETSTKCIDNTNTRPNPHQQCRQSQLPHQIVTDEDNIVHPTITTTNTNTITTTMPSKAATCLPRQRSRAIAIKRSRPVDRNDFIDTSDDADSQGAFVEKEARRCDVELYDYATWRMYNRIIEHRRQNLVRIQHQDDPAQDQRQRAQKNHQSSATNQASTSSTIDDCDSDSDHNGRGMVHPSSMMHGQRCYVYHNAPYTYASDHYGSGNEDYDEIFDLEL